MAESVIGPTRPNVSAARRFRTVDDLELAHPVLAALVQTARLHSALDYATPTEFEEHYYRHINTRQRQLSGQPSLH